MFIVMYVSRESVEKTHSRLRSVIKKSRLKVYGENYYFCETAVGDREFMPDKVFLTPLGVLPEKLIRLPKLLV